MSTHSETSSSIFLEDAAFVHPSALVFGDVRLGKGASLWPNVVIRSEMFEVRIGERTNVQDFVMIHVGAGTGTYVGSDCSITHHCTLHGCRIGDRVLVGIGSTIMDGCEIGDNTIIAGGTFLKEGTLVPANSIVMGAPGVVKRTRNNAAANGFNAWLYHENALAYARGEHRLWSQSDFLVRAAAEQRRLAALHPDATAGSG
jgi:carbonic anhydrase/acetyltransferase-like protein (isoleucine patch superfamily)